MGIKLKRKWVNYYFNKQNAIFLHEKYFGEEPYGWIFKLNDGTIGIPCEIPTDDLSKFDITLTIGDNTHYFETIINMKETDGKSEIDDKKYIKLFKKSDVAEYYFGIGKTVSIKETISQKKGDKYNAVKGATEGAVLNILFSIGVTSKTRPYKAGFRK